MDKKEELKKELNKATFEDLQRFCMFWMRGFCNIKMLPQNKSGLINAIVEDAAEEIVPYQKQINVFKAFNPSEE